MSLQSNSFENLITSFRNVCSDLEAKAQMELDQINRDCDKEFASSGETLFEFNELLSGISNTCSELMDNRELLKSVVVQPSTKKNSINLPYEIQTDVVKCISELYNMSPQKNTSDEEIVNEISKEIVDEIIKVSEKNTNVINDAENAIVEAKEII